MIDWAGLFRDQKTLSRVQLFLDEIKGDEGLTGAQVDRLCGIAHHREDLPLTPYDEMEQINGR